MECNEYSYHRRKWLYWKKSVNQTSRNRCRQYNRIKPKNSDIKQEEAFREADFIFHLAGANRPKNQEDFYLDNVDYTERI